MGDKPITAVGPLRQREIEFGPTFKRFWQADHAPVFVELLNAIDEADARSTDASERYLTGLERESKRKAELLKLAGICRKQAAITSTPMAKAALTELAEQYEAEAGALGSLPLRAPG